MFLSVVILGRFTTETHAMALYISTDTPPLFTPRPGTFPRQLRISVASLDASMMLMEVSK